MTNTITNKIKLDQIRFEDRLDFKSVIDLNASEYIPMENGCYQGKHHHAGYGFMFFVQKEAIGSEYKDWWEDEIYGNMSWMFHNIDLAHPELSGKICVLDRIELEPEYRRNGLGTSALKQIIGYAKFIGCTAILLECSPLGFNLPNRDELKLFFQSIGFQDYRITKEKYGERHYMKYDIE